MKSIKTNRYQTRTENIKSWSFKRFSFQISCNVYSEYLGDIKEFYILKKPVIHKRYQQCG